MKRYVNGIFPLVLAIVPAQVILADETVVAESLSTERQALRLIKIADEFDQPTSMAILPGELYLVTERGGRLQMVHDGMRQEVGGLPEIEDEEDGGLLEIVSSPAFPDTGWLYLTYASGDDESTAAALGRARLAGNHLVDWEPLFEQNRRSSPGEHYGARLAWLPDDTLLMSIGDRGTPGRAQDTNDHAGSLLRLDPQGLAPEDNPRFEDVGFLPELYSWGHRNIQGLAVHPDTGDAWAVEARPNGSDELSLIHPGSNHGWPQLTLGEDADTPGIIDEVASSRLFTDDEIATPAHEFSEPVAPSGMALVTSEHYPDWQGDLIVGGREAKRLYRIMLDGREVVETEVLLDEEVGGISDVRQGPDGYLYVLSETNGALYRLEPAH